MGSETAYIITSGDRIVGDSRTFLSGDVVDPSLVDLCRAADLHEGMNVEMITYLPVETYAKRDTVYAVYRTEGIPVLGWGYNDEAVAAVRSQGTMLGHVRCIAALWD